ncbi:MAG: Rpn family recombination-promoting nuclease/putative transposase [Enterococcus sp.]
MQVYLPTNDLLFKKLLTSEDSQHILKAFVKDLLGLEFERLIPKQTYHIDSYKKSYEEREKMEVKLTEVDILAVAEDGSYTTIECQVQSQKYFHERSLFYLGEAYRSPFGNIAKNEVKKSNFSSLRPAYGINIVNFHLFDDTENALQLFHLINPQTHRPFLNKEGKELLVLCFLSLKNEVIDSQHAVYHWYYYFKTGEVKADAPTISKKRKRKQTS